MGALPEIWGCCKARGGSLLCAPAHLQKWETNLQG